MRELKVDESKHRIEELRRLYRGGKDARVQRRVVGIKMMIEEDLSSYEVARRLSVSATAVTKWGMKGY
jgi:hypothetical protein